jgi:hypothetical protein
MSIFALSDKNRNWIIAIALARISKDEVVLESLSTTWTGAFPFV